MQPNDQQGYYQPVQGQPQANGQQAYPPQPTQTPISNPEENTTQPLGPVAVQAALDETSQPVQGSMDAATDPGQDEAVTWTAKEYLHQEKGAGWFVGFTVIIVALLGVAVFLQQWSFAVLIVVIAAVIIVSSKRPPRELSYALTDEGLVIDDKLNSFKDFKAFGVIRDGDEFSVMLIPTKRFQPGVTVYFPEESGEAIVDMLGSRLPMKDLKLDAVDRVVRLLRL